MATNNFKQDLIEFEKLEDVTLETGRLYKTPRGMIYPSVTTALGSMSKDGIESWRKRVGEAEANKITTQATRRGTRLHNMLEKYMMNDPTYRKGTMPVDIDLFTKIRKVLDENVTCVRGQEFALYSDVLKVAGRCDMLCDYAGKLSVVDFKSASKEKKHEHIINYMYQATAYCLMIGELKGITVDTFHVIIASEEPKAQVFSGSVDTYRKDCVEFFASYYVNQNYNQELLTEMYGK